MPSLLLYCPSFMTSCLKIIKYKKEECLPIYCCNNVNTFRFNPLFSVCNSRVKVMVFNATVSTIFQLYRSGKFY